MLGLGSNRVDAGGSAEQLQSQVPVAVALLTSTSRLRCGAAGRVASTPIQIAFKGQAHAFSGSLSTAGRPLVRAQRNISNTFLVRGMLSQRPFAPGPNHYGRDVVLARWITGVVGLDCLLQGLHISGRSWREPLSQCKVIVSANVGLEERVRLFLKLS